MEFAGLRIGIANAVPENITIATAASANLFIATSINLIAPLYPDFAPRQQKAVPSISASISYEGRRLVTAR